MVEGDPSPAGIEDAVLLLRTEVDRALYAVVDVGERADAHGRVLARHTRRAKHAHREHAAVARESRRDLIATRADDACARGSMTDFVIGIGIFIGFVSNMVVRVAGTTAGGKFGEGLLEISAFERKE